MLSTNVSRLKQRLLSGDFQGLLHTLRLLLGLRGSVPRPEVFLSRFDSPDSPRAKLASAPLSALPVKLLVFSHNLGREGASISLKELICELNRGGAIQAQIVAFEDGPLRREYQTQGIPVSVLPAALRTPSTVKRLGIEVERLASFIQKSRVDVVFANTLLTFPAILAAEHAGVPSVWNPRESEPWDSYFRFLPDPVAQRAIGAIGLPRKVVFVANATRAVWEKFEGAGKFTVIRNALNKNRFREYLAGDKDTAREALGWVMDEVVFLCVGTICERKGQEDAVLALGEIAEGLEVPVRLVFAGDASSSYARHLKRLTLQLTAKGNVGVDFVSATENIGRYYLAADVFLLCSRVESYPRVILEAMAFGLPIISTPVFGVREQLPDPEDACFYEPRDIPSLSGHLLALANSQPLRQDLGRRSRDRFSRLPSFGEMCQCYLEVIRSAQTYSTGKE